MQPGGGGGGGRGRGCGGAGVRGAGQTLAQRSETPHRGRSRAGVVYTLACVHL